MPTRTTAFRKQTAVGIHSGTVTNDNTRARYTEIDFALTAYKAWVNY